MEQANSSGIGSTPVQEPTNNGEEQGANNVTDEKEFELDQLSDTTSISEEEMERLLEQDVETVEASYFVAACCCFNFLQTAHPGVRTSVLLET